MAEMLVKTPTLNPGGAAPNTIKLRKEYGEWVSDQQLGGGEILDFHQWAQKYYPQKPVLPP